jgi:hypothetical protein
MIGWVNGLFLQERTKTSRNVTISVTISFSQSSERATAARGRVQLVFYTIGSQMAVKLSALLADHIVLPGRFLVLISVRS